MKEFKFEDESDLLIDKFETGFDDDLEAIPRANFIGMVTILPAKFRDTIGSEDHDHDCCDVIPGQ